MNRTRLLAASAAFVLTTALTPVKAETPKDTLVIGIWIDDMISLDPAELFEFTASEAIGNAYERLFVFDAKEETRIRPQLAESWQVSEDGKVLTFKLHENRKFASGNSLTAEDAVFSLQRAVTLNLSPAFILTQFGFTKDNVKDKIKQTGPYEFTFEMDKPYAPSFVLNCLTSTVSAITDKKLLLQHEKDGDLGHAWLKTQYAGSGPFKISVWKANEALILERNDHAVIKTPLKRIIYRHVKEISTQRMMLEKGDLDIARKLDADQLNAIESNKNIDIVSGPKSNVYYLGLNQKNETLAKPEVKEALKYLIDYDALSATLIKRIGKKHQYFLPEGMLGSLTDMPYNYDIEKAKGLLEKAGLKDGFKVTMDTRNVGLILGIGQALQQTFAKADVKLEIIPGDSKQTLTKYRTRQHDIYIGQWGADYQDPHTNASTFALNIDNSDGAANKPLAWRNSWAVPDSINALTEEASIERDSEKRIKMYHTLQKEVNEQGPFIFLYQDIETWAVRSNVKGYVIGPSMEANELYNITK